MKAAGLEPILKHSRWCLRRTEPTSKTSRADLLQYNLRTVRSFLLKEDFQFFWEYTSPYWAVNSWMPGAGGRCDPGSSP